MLAHAMHGAGVARRRDLGAYVCFVLAEAIAHHAIAERLLLPCRHPDVGDSIHGAAPVEIHDVNTRPDVYIDVHRARAFDERRHEVGIEAGQQPVAHFEHRGRRAGRGRDVREFERDEAAAHGGDPFRKAIALEKQVARGQVVGPRDRESGRPSRPRAARRRSPYRGSVARGQSFRPRPPAPSWDRTRAAHTCRRTGRESTTATRQPAARHVVATDIRHQTPDCCARSMKRRRFAASRGKIR